MTSASHPPVGGLTADDLAAKIMAMMNTPAPAVGYTDKELKTYRDESLIVSPPSVGNQVIVNGPKGRGTFSRGSTAFAVVGLLPALADFIVSIHDPAAAAIQNHDWLAVAGLALTGLTVAAQKWSDRASFEAAAKVATAAVDPVGQVPAVQVAPRPAPAPGATYKADISQFSDDQLRAALAARAKAP